MRRATGEVAGGGTRRREEEGRGQETAVAKSGGGKLWTVGARGDRCPGPSPSGYVGLRELKETPASPRPLLGAVRLLFTLYQAGALRGWARRHPPSSEPHPKPTHIPQFFARAPALPTRPGGSTHARPQ